MNLRSPTAFSCPTIARKKVVTVVIIACLTLQFPSYSHALSQGEYMAWGVVSAVVGVILGAASIGQFQKGSRLATETNHQRDFGLGGRSTCTGTCKELEDASRKATLTGVVLIVAGLASVSISAYCFNRATKRHGAFLNMTGTELALGIPTVSYDIESHGANVSLFEGRF